MVPGLLLKVIVVPAIVLISDFLIASVFYPAYYQPILVGVVLALIGHLLDKMFLRPGTLWATTALDIAAFAIVLYLSAYFFPGARMPLDGALLTALFLGLTEYYYHRWLIDREIENKA